jgi:hypothetical protein
MNWLESVQTVSSRADLARFLSEAAVDCQQNPGEWSNRELKTFLEAMAAWIQDMDGYYKNRNEPVPVRPDWKVFAEMVAAARVYE